MCGITGIWGTTDTELVAEMMRRLVHRGPDAHGMFRAPRGTLGHRRLSIMDPEGGDQPILSGDGKRAIVGNGEIYNFPTLRPQLAKRHTLRTRSDTESALHLYEQCAQDAATKLDGMFAFALADGDDLYVARDPIGIKPLYFGRRGQDRVFASELKALAGVATDVREFPPGTWFHSRLGSRRYYQVPHVEVEDRPLDEHLRRVRATLERSVIKRLMSDVPVGAFLSGGLDSSLIAAIAKRELGRLHTFSVGVEGSRDLAAARVVADHIGSDHHEYVFTRQEVLEALPQIVFHLESFDQDLVRSAIPCYFTSRLASQYVKVILTGEGADELFAGYAYYRQTDYGDRLNDELRRSVASLHNVNLQRVDRLTMAHSLEGRVPFLDTDMIELAQTVPGPCKLFDDGTGRVVEKWILRKACEDLLPDEIVWRGKEQFDEGSGTVDLLATGLERFGPCDDPAAFPASAQLRSHEERVYYKLLHEAYDGSDVILSNVARWAHRPEPDALTA